MEAEQAPDAAKPETTMVAKPKAAAKPKDASKPKKAGAPNTVSRLYLLLSSSLMLSAEVHIE
jgi:hypothetical protein